jgi:hypothetical protein
MKSAIYAMALGVAKVICQQFANRRVYIITFFGGLASTTALTSSSVGLL